jgi:hypothetical protein
MNAALTLNWLEEQRRDALAVVAKAGGERIRIAEFDVLESRRQRPKSVGVMELPGQRERAERLAVK